MRQPLDYYAIPDPVTGYPPQLDGAFSVIIPEATANLCTNPSFEIDTTGHVALNGAVAQTATKQRRGVYACQITPNANVEAGDFFALTLTAGQPYAFSVDLWGEPGKWYNLYVGDTSNNRLSPFTHFQGTGYWERISVIYYESTGATRRFFLTRSAYADTNAFYTDGWQIENKDHVTTYCDGDMVGFVRNQVDFGWSGTPHASASWRSGQTKAGGKEVNLKDLGLTILSVIGLGLGSIGNVAIPNVDGGSFDQTSVRKDRQFTLAGQLSGISLPDLQRTRKGLQAALDTFNTAKRQPLVLTYQLQDEDGHPVSEKVNIRGKYNSGLGGQYDNNYAENVGIVFDSYLPAIMNEGEKGQALSYQQTVALANYILERDNTGLWKALGTGMNLVVGALAIGSDGVLYAGGQFTLAGGVANTAYIAKWNGTTWMPLGTGMNGIVDALAIGPDGSLYAGGAFTLAGGVANTVHIAKWNGSAWSALGTGTNGTVWSLAVGPDGSVYAGGDFTLAGGVASTVRIAKWNGSAWSALGTGSNNNTITNLVIGPDGALYAGGSFTQMSGVANTAYIAKWSSGAWSALGSGMDSHVNALTVGPDGALYAGGSFTLAGGVSASCIAKWNGSAWIALGTGVSVNVYTLVFGPDGVLYVGGNFTVAGGLATPDSLAVWNGSSWAYIDVDAPGSPTLINAIVFDNSGNLYIGFIDSGSAVSAYITTLTNSGSADTYPKVTFTGPGSVYQLRNVTTGKTIYFHLVLNAGEVATLNLDPNALSFTSSFRGNIRDAILRGSDLNFYLQPGDNLISVFVAGTTTAATKVTIIDREAYNSLDGTIR